MTVTVLRHPYACKDDNLPRSSGHSVMKLAVTCMFSLQAPVMAHSFKERISCLFCARYLEKPVYLKCGYTCCLRCTDTLERSPDGEGILCPHCSVVSLKEDILPAMQLERLITKVKKLEPWMKHILKMNPRLKIFQGKKS